jgi:transcription antitermination factor NusG
MELQDKKWFAVYTRPRWEKKTSELLTLSQIETYCPVNKVVRKWADRKKTILEPLFTSYCFVRIAPTDQFVVRQTPGVINFVYWLGKPAVIREEEINLVKQFLDEYSTLALEKLNVSLNDRVRITKGAFMEHEGPVIEIRPHTVRIQLPSLGVALIAEISKAAVEVIRAADSSLAYRNLRVQ